MSTKNNEVLQMCIRDSITSLCKASNLVELFVSLEVLTLSSFIMVGYFRRNLGSTEAGIKYQMCIRDRK